MGPVLISAAQLNKGIVDINHVPGIVVRTGGVNEKGGIPNLGNMTASKRIGHVPRGFL